MRRKIPSSLALIAFEAAARHQSFTIAADELSLTQSAVCRRIAGLEEFLGVKLFKRTRRGILLTEAGAKYSVEVTTQLDEMERGAVGVMSNGTGGSVLELAVAPTFATLWLLPRLGGFFSSHPEIAVNITSRTKPFLFEGARFDAAVYAGDSNWPGTEGVLLMPEKLVVVASPNLIEPHRTITPTELSQMRLLQLEARPYEWRLWFASLGLRVDNDLSGPRMDVYSMLIKAAIHGLGVALIPRPLVEEDLRSGLLIEPFKYHHQSRRSFYLLYPERKSELPQVQAFRIWLKQELGKV